MKKKQNFHKAIHLIKEQTIKPTLCHIWKNTFWYCLCMNVMTSYSETSKAKNMYFSKCDFSSL